MRQEFKGYKVGDVIQIIDMAGEPKYAGRTGIIEHIDDAGQLHGSWGCCALLVDEDNFKVIRR